MPKLREVTAVSRAMTKTGILAAFICLFGSPARAMEADGAAAPSTPAYIVLAQNAILVRSSCGVSGLATLDLIEDNGQSAEHIEAKLEGLREDPLPSNTWALILLQNGSLRAGQKYTLTIPSTSITNAPSCYSDKAIAVDTNPKVSYVANSTSSTARPGTQRGRLVSTVAFALPGNTTPVNLGAVGCKVSESGCVDVTLELGGT